MEPSAARGRAITQAEEETVQIIEDRVYAFSKDNPPCYTAQPGEVLQFNTLDCFSGRLTDETVTMKDMDFSYNITNPAAGPVYVEGAEVGDVLVVDIYDIQVADEGTIATDDHCGPLFEGTDYRTKKIKIEGGMADFNGVRFPINPMIGVIGTAPDEGAPADGFVGNYGGNMDNKLITKGTRLYFPVRVPGALLQMGDVHATMGDAELCGTGIEIAAQITVGENRLPRSFWITSTGRIPPCSLPCTGFRSAIKISPRVISMLSTPMGRKSWSQPPLSAYAPFKPRVTRCAAPRIRPTRSRPARRAAPAPLRPRARGSTCPRAPRPKRSCPAPAAPQSSR